MKLVPLALCLLLVGCQRAEESQPRPTVPAPTTVVAASAAAPAPEAPASACSGGCSCGGSCGGEPAGDPAASVPADAVWAELRVDGMHCGGCARRIRSALAGVDGIYGVEVDVGARLVKVAMAPGKDARATAASRIDALGYRVAR